MATSDPFGLLTIISMSSYGRASSICAIVVYPAIESNASTSRVLDVVVLAIACGTIADSNRAIVVNLTMILFIFVCFKSINYIIFPVFPQLRIRWQDLVLFCG